MSLVKTYAVACEGPYLTLRLQEAERLNGIQLSTREHQPFSSYAVSSKTARQLAKSRGWTRPRVTLPIFRNQSKGQTTDHRFDLCPSCTKMLTAVL